MVIRTLNKSLLSLQIIIISCAFFVLTSYENFGIIDVFEQLKILLLVLPLFLLIFIEKDFCAKYMTDSHSLILKHKTVFDDERYQKGYKIISICIIIATVYIAISRFNWIYFIFFLS